MASQGGRVVHQDYIVRQRYSNALPPPPGAPKLFEIPNNGMKRYTMPFYAEPLLREQPINIEADAFMGMPIDLVGMPGVFDGDESSIQAPEFPPPVHPRDAPLLTPLKQLGKKKSEAADISFLRRTQYTAEDRARLEAVRGTKANPSFRQKKDETANARDDPKHLLRSVIKGFDISNPESAYTGPDTDENTRGLNPSFAERDAWNKPVHPTKSHLKPVDTYPLLPDLEALTNSIAYGVVRINGQPTDKTDGPDPRLAVSLFHALDPTPADLADWEARKTRHAADPEHHPPPPPEPEHDYCLFRPQDHMTTAAFARQANPQHLRRDEPHVNAEGGAKLRFENVRRYAIGRQQLLADFPYQEVALTLDDGDAAKADPDADMEDEEGPVRRKRQPGAYFLPVISKQQLRPRPTAENEGDCDVLEVEVREPGEDEMEEKRAWLADVDPRDY